MMMMMMINVVGWSLSQAPVRVLSFDYKNSTFLSLSCLVPGGEVTS
jgi:hypothetical protein